MKNGSLRSGSMLMLASVVLSVLSVGLPLYFASSQPDHEWSILLSGFPAFCMSMSGAVAATLYIIGFIQYCWSKGYSTWLGFWLLLANVPGFIVLLLLPDLKVERSLQSRISTRPQNSHA